MHQSLGSLTDDLPTSADSGPCFLFLRSGDRPSRNLCWGAPIGHRQRRCEPSFSAYETERRLTGCCPFCGCLPLPVRLLTGLPVYYHVIGSALCPSSQLKPIWSLPAGCQRQISLCTLVQIEARMLTISLRHGILIARPYTGMQVSVQVPSSAPSRFRTRPLSWQSFLSSVTSGLRRSQQGHHGYQTGFGSAVGLSESEPLQSEGTVFHLLCLFRHYAQGPRERLCPARIARPKGCRSPQRGDIPSCTSSLS